MAHINDVARRVQEFGDEYIIVALLHDYREDVPDKAISVETLSKHIRYKYGARVANGCTYLSNKEGLSGKTPHQAAEKHVWQLNHLKDYLNHMHYLR